MLTPIKKQGDEHIYILLQIGIINWISVCYVDILRFVWMLIGSEIVSRNYAASGKGPLCSGASQFAAGYAAAQLSIDKRMSCTVSDDALPIIRAHYEMQINRDFTLIRDVGATADEIPERRRRAGPHARDAGATGNEIPERRRRAGPPTDSAGHL